MCKGKKYKFEDGWIRGESLKVAVTGNKCGSGVLRRKVLHH